MRHAWSLLSIILIVITGIASCKEEVHRTPVGEPCSEEEQTLCDSLCLLDLPNGMCSHDCSSDESICPDGFACGDISDGRYCLKSCSEDGDCRDGMVCVIGECRLPMILGAACEEDDDCESEICYDGQCDVAVGFGWDCHDGEDCHSGLCYEHLCNLECHSPRDCPEGLSCIDPGSGVPVCLEYEPPEGGPGRYGENCTFEDCDDGFICLTRTEDAVDDPYAFCTDSCRTELECPADMTCRRTQRVGSVEATFRCVPRVYCERCSYDGQCGSTADKCVSRDPARGEGRYCSQTCDIESPVTTCPTDNSCHEALWCAPDRSWVADCEWCSDPDECDSLEDGPVYQCFSDYGACAGEGEDDDYCAPCFVDADCPVGGHCQYDFYQRNAFCTAPCPDGESGGCEYEHACWSFPDEDEEWQCVPRSGSCSIPSGGVTSCYPCDGYGDCVSGQCLPWDLAYGPTMCWEDCSKTECPVYTQCYQLTDTGGATFHLCGPPDGWTCAQSQLCQDACPEGPDSCAADARTYCFDWPE